jgi:lysine-ketoglutarate reductase/saccharopine dehydrogenase-like protein (TIGR00300 family)
MPPTAPASEVLEAEGHLVDSQILNRIFDKVIERGGSFDVQRFEIGRTNEDFSHLTIKVTAPGETQLQALIEDLIPLGCHPIRAHDAIVRPAPKDRCAPADFYSTTNYRTHVRVAPAPGAKSRWIEVEDQRMDAVIVLEGERAVCRKLRAVRTGDLVVCGVEGIKVSPEFRERDRFGFTFMSSDNSSERHVEASVTRIAAMMREVKRTGGRIAFVVGPVAVHTGGVPHLAEIIRQGYMDVMLAGNAVAVHDVEFALFGTSLGIDLEAGLPVHHGHQHHMRAINAVNTAGSLAAAVEQGVLKSGLMFECVRHEVPFILAGSIRDDGPLPDTVMNLIEAQDRYAAALADVQLVVVLSSMLHGIGVGNMIPAWVRMVCVDINPAVVTKLADRGSSQTVGLVTDVGLFLNHLAVKLRQ